jgi:hypothetical protein
MKIGSAVFGAVSIGKANGRRSETPGNLTLVSAFTEGGFT